MHYASSVQVLVWWLHTLDLPVDGIGDTLPAEPDEWATNGYVQIPTTVGGSPNVDVPQRQPVMQVDCWANRPNSELAPWNRAESLASRIVEAAQAQRGPITLTVPAGFRPVQLKSVWPRTEPRRLPNDPSRFARVSLDLEMRWVLL